MSSFLREIDGEIALEIRDHSGATLFYLTGQKLDSPFEPKQLSLNHPKLLRERDRSIHRTLSSERREHWRTRLQRRLHRLIDLFFKTQEQTPC